MEYRHHVMTLSRLGDSDIYTVECWKCGVVGVGYGQSDARAIIGAHRDEKQEENVNVGPLAYRRNW